MGEIDEDAPGGPKMFWQDMPLAIDMALSQFRTFDQRHHPYSCIVLAISQIKDASESLRPSDEIAEAI